MKPHHRLAVSTLKVGAPGQPRLTRESPRQEEKMVNQRRKWFGLAGPGQADMGEAACGAQSGLSGQLHYRIKAL